MSGKLLCSRPVLAIDPGVKGAYAFVDQYRRDYVRCTPFRSMEALWGELQHICKAPGNRWLYVVMEEVHASPVQGPRQAFSFGANNQIWLCWLHALGFTPHMVAPSAWQAHYRKELYGLQGPPRKKKLVEIAHREWPDQNFTGVTADAALLATHALNHLVD